MNYLNKYTALFLALILCLTVLAGCVKKELDPDEDTTPSQGQDQPDESERPTPELLSDTITCSDGETTLRFEKNDQGQWQWKDDPTFPLDTTYVDALIATVQQILSSQPIVTDKTPEDLDLDDQRKYLTITDEKGHKVTWYLGDKNDDGCYYMCLSGDTTNAIYLAPAELTAQISRSIYDMMILPQLQEMAAANIRSVTVATAEKTVTTVPNSSGVWVVGISSVNEIAQPMIQALSKLQIDSCLDYNPTNGAAAICGLESPQATVTVEFANSTGVESSLSFAIGAKLSRGYCVTLGEDTTIYLIKAELVEPILAFMK